MKCGENWVEQSALSNILWILPSYQLGMQKQTTFQAGRDEHLECVCFFFVFFFCWNALRFNHDPKNSAETELRSFCDHWNVTVPPSANWSKAGAHLQPSAIWDVISLIRLSLDKMFPVKTAQKFAANFLSNAASDRHFYFQLMLNCACRGTWRQSLHKEPKGSLDVDQAHIPPFLTGGVEGGGGAWVELSLMLAKSCECSHDLLLSFQKLWKEGYFLLCCQSTQSLASI